MICFPAWASESHPPYPLPARAKSINPRSTSVPIIQTQQEDYYYEELCDEVIS